MSALHSHHPHPHRKSLTIGYNPSQELFSLLPGQNGWTQRLWHFYDALRSRLIHDMVTVSVQRPSLTQRQIKRLRDGLLLSQVSSSSSWDYNFFTRSVSLLFGFVLRFLLLP